MSFQPIIHCIGGPCDGVSLEFDPATMSVAGAAVRITYKPVRTVSSQNEIDLKYLTTGYYSDNTPPVNCLYRVGGFGGPDGVYFFLYHEKTNSPISTIVWALRNYRGSGEAIPTVERLGKDLNADYPYPACVKNHHQAPAVVSFVSVNLDARNIDISKL